MCGSSGSQKSSADFNDTKATGEWLFFLEAPEENPLTYPFKKATHIPGQWPFHPQASSLLSDHLVQPQSPLTSAGKDPPG